MATKDDLYSFEKDAKPRVELTGFWPPEDGFVWSTGSWCEIAVPPRAKAAQPGAAAEIALDVDVFKSPPELEGQNVFFYLNGRRVASRFITKRVTVLLEVAERRADGSPDMVTIDTPDAARPNDHGKQDTRRLGVQLFSVAVRGE